MDLYEYQGKELFRRYGIPVSTGRLATSGGEALDAAQELGGRVVVKAQVLTGGRGKAGGVQVAASAAEAEEKARTILGLDIRGHLVSKVWIEPATEIAKEYYAAVALDRSARKPLIMLTTQGGVEIESVAAGSLKLLLVDPLAGPGRAQIRRLVEECGISDSSEQAQVGQILEQLYACFVAEDALLCEINPLAVTPAGEVLALDAKVTIDDAALFRHPETAEMRDLKSVDPLEALAREKGVTYVKLDGSVGILGNGAGLAMSTVDVVAVAGGSPANFCDLGGGGSAAGVVAALEVISQDPQVRSILFNIFGGITRCDEVARGILEALDRIVIDVPLVVRFDGTNAVDGRAILVDSGRPGIHVSPTMLDAARTAVELAA